MRSPNALDRITLQTNFEVGRTTLYLKLGTHMSLAILILTVLFVGLLVGLTNLNLSNSFYTSIAICEIENSVK